MGGWGVEAEPPGLGDFCYFSRKMTLFMHISAKTHQFKAFKSSLNVLNWINEVQVL